MPHFIRLVQCLITLPFCQTMRKEYWLDLFRRLSARIGKAKAITATARKIAVLFYNALRHGMKYTDPGAAYYEERYRQRVLSNLQRRAKAFGYVLQAAPPKPPKREFLRKFV